MPNPRLAGRYAKSLIDLAIEKKELDKVYEDMLLLKSLCSNSREFVILLKSPVVSADKKVKILDALTKGKVTHMTDIFTKLLIHKGREFYLPEIIDAFIKQYKDFNQIHLLKLTTAVALSDELKNAIVEQVKTETSLKKIELDSQVKEEIIGGFVLEVGDKMIDASVAYELANIKKQFDNNDYMYKVR
jgi:F-type H+-transporting ATPase subunit delta